MNISAFLISALFLRNVSEKPIFRDFYILEFYFYDTVFLVLNDIEKLQGTKSVKKKNTINKVSS